MQAWHADISIVCVLCSDFPATQHLCNVLQTLHQSRSGKICFAVVNLLSMNRGWYTRYVAFCAELVTKACIGVHAAFSEELLVVKLNMMSIAMVFCQAESQTIGLFAGPSMIPPPPPPPPLPPHYDDVLLVILQELRFLCMRSANQGELQIARTAFSNGIAVIACLSCRHLYSIHSTQAPSQHSKKTD